MCLKVRRILSLPSFGTSLLVKVGLRGLATAMSKWLKPREVIVSDLKPYSEIGGDGGDQSEAVRGNGAYEQGAFQR